MEDRHFILLDATLESQAPFFAQNPIFQRWLRSWDNVPEALKCISEIALPNSIQVYMPRDNILDDGLPSDTNGETRTLIQTFCDLQTIQHVTIFSPEINDGLEQEIRAIISNPRLIRDVISTVDLHSHMCNQGVQHFQYEITRYKSKTEVHLIPNLVRDRDDLMEYWKKIIDEQKKPIDTLVEEHSNKPSEESS